MKAFLSPANGRVVGVGMPIIAKLSAKPQDRAQVEALMSVKTSKPVVGAWHWFSDTELHWRPREFWPARTKVDVRADLDGVQFGKDVYGSHTTVTDFRIGDAMVSTVDVDDHVMTVTRNGDEDPHHPDHDGQRVLPDPQRDQGHPHPRARPDDGLVDGRHPGGQPGRVPDRRRVRDAPDLERRVHPRGTVVGAFAGPGQRQPRLHRHEHGQRRLDVREQPRRRRRDVRRLRPPPRAGQRLHRLEPDLEAVEGRLGPPRHVDDVVLDHAALDQRGPRRPRRPPRQGPPPRPREAGATYPHDTDQPRRTV